MLIFSMVVQSPYYMKIYPVTMVSVGYHCGLAVVYHGV